MPPPQPPGTSPAFLLATLALALALLFAFAGRAAGILQTTGANSLCDAPGCSCQRASLLYCRCSPKQELSMRSSGYDYLPPLITSITIENCFKLSVGSRCLERLEGLRQVRLSNISHLELEEFAFSWGSSEIQESYPYPGINVTLEDSRLPRLPSSAFRGSLGTVSLVRLSLGEVKSFAFSNLAATERIELLDCRIETVEPQAFKKFITDYLVVSGGSIALLPSHAVVDVQVKRDLRLKNVAFGRVRSSAVRVNGPAAFRLQGCTVGVLEGDAFRVLVRGPVFLEDNTFLEVGPAPFLGVSVDPRFAAHAGKQEIVFENNTLLAFVDGSLTFDTTHFEPTVDRIVIERACACAEVAAWTSKLVRFTGTPGPVPGVGRLMWCKKGQRETGVEEYYGKHCTSRHPVVYTAVAVAAALLALAAAACALGFCFYRRRLKRYINVPTDSNRHSTYSTGSNRVMVVPDGKTYRETELHVIVERAEPITEYKAQALASEPPADG